MRSHARRIQAYEYGFFSVAQQRTSIPRLLLTQTLRAWDAWLRFWSPTASKVAGILQDIEAVASASESDSHVAEMQLSPTVESLACNCMLLCRTSTSRRRQGEWTGLAENEEWGQTSVSSV
jgi:hypothetical protein